MARMKAADSIDAKISKAQETVVRMKGRYDSALAALEDLMAKKDELLKKELLEAFVKSGKSYAETMKFLKER
jgi:hypothetical protein